MDTSGDMKSNMKDKKQCISDYEYYDVKAKVNAMLNKIVESLPRRMQLYETQTGDVKNSEFWRFATDKVSQIRKLKVKVDREREILTISCPTEILIPDEIDTIFRMLGTYSDLLKSLLELRDRWQSSLESCKLFSDDAMDLSAYVELYEKLTKRLSANFGLDGAGFKMADYNLMTQIYSRLVWISEHWAVHDDQIAIEYIEQVFEGIGINSKGDADTNAGQSEKSNSQIIPTTGHLPFNDVGSGDHLEPNTENEMPSNKLKSSAVKQRIIPEISHDEYKIVKETANSKIVDVMRKMKQYVAKVNDDENSGNLKEFWRFVQDKLSEINHMNAKLQREREVLLTSVIFFPDKLPPHQRGHGKLNQMMNTFFDLFGVLLELESHCLSSLETLGLYKGKELKLSEYELIYEALTKHQNSKFDWDGAEFRATDCFLMNEIHSRLIWISGFWVIPIGHSENVVCMESGEIVKTDSATDAGPDQMSEMSPTATFSAEDFRQVGKYEPMTGDDTTDIDALVEASYRDMRVMEYHQMVQSQPCHHTGCLCPYCFMFSPDSSDSDEPVSMNPKGQEGGSQPKFMDSI